VLKHRDRRFVDRPSGSSKMLLAASICLLLAVAPPSRADEHSGPDGFAICAPEAADALSPASAGVTQQMFQTQINLARP